MKLVQSRIVTENVERLAAFYARLVEVPVGLNDYYVEVPAGPTSVGFSKRRFTEYHRKLAAAAAGAAGGGTQDLRPEVVLDFLVDDVDAEYGRISALGVEWVLPPATQPWGNRSMIFRDPEGNLINVFSRRTASSVRSRTRPPGDMGGHRAAGPSPGPAVPGSPYSDV